MNSLETWLHDALELRRVVEEQARDEVLWVSAQTASEGYLQHELRRLHYEVERATHRLAPE